MNEIEYRNFKSGCITCKFNIKATRINVTNDFRIKFRYMYVFVHSKTTLSMECQKM